MLPAPEIGIPAVEIAKFKERHGEALRRFRRMLERRVLDLAAGDPRLLHQRLDAVSEEIHDGIEEVQSLMSRASWRRIGRRRSGQSLSRPVQRSALLPQPVI